MEILLENGVPVAFSWTTGARTAVGKRERELAVMETNIQDALTLAEEAEERGDSRRAQILFAEAVMLDEAKRKLPRSSASPTHRAA